MLLHALTFHKILPLFSAKSLRKLSPAFKWHLSEKKDCSQVYRFCKAHTCSYLSWNTYLESCFLQYLAWSEEQQTPRRPKVAVVLPFSSGAVEAFVRLLLCPLFLNSRLLWKDPIWATCHENGGVKTHYLEFKHWNQTWLSVWQIKGRTWEQMAVGSV